MRLPNVKKPCANCPFKTDALKGWLGKERMTEILAADSFVCHKTIDGKRERLQCAGHILIKGDENQFVRMAKQLKIPLKLSGREEVFATKEECIKHHEIL